MGGQELLNHQELRKSASDAAFHKMGQKGYWVLTTQFEPNGSNFTCKYLI